MTIIVTAKVTDGIVLAADSAASFFLPTAGGVIAKIYNHANKVFNLRKVWSIGAMVDGNTLAAAKHRPSELEAAFRRLK